MADVLADLRRRYSQAAPAPSPALARELAALAAPDEPQPEAAAPEQAQAKQWPEPQPIPDGLPAVEPFAGELLPDAWRPWIEDVAERMQCPPEYVAVAAIVALSAVVGRRLAIRPKAVDDWTVVVNVWGAIVGRPGVLKTPAIEEALRHLALLEARARKEFEAALRSYEAQRMVHEAQRKQAKDDVARAVKEGRDASEIAQAAVGGAPPAAPACRRHRTNDTTIEKLGVILNENPRGVLVHRDELMGFLRTLDREGHEGDRAFYLEAWNGTGRFTYDRVGRGTIEIEAACVSILGGIQPGPLSSYISSAARGGVGDDGLVQRFQLLVWPDPPAGEWANVDRAPDTAARVRVTDVFDQLDQLDPVAVGAQIPDKGLPYLRFSPDAQEVFTEWRTELEHRLRAGELPPIMEAHLSKYRSLVPSLALLLHLADDGTGPVTRIALVKACAWAEYLESHAWRVYAPALSPGAVGARTLADHIQAGDLGTEFAARDVHRRQWSGLTEREAVGEALSLLVDLDWLREEVTPTAGRPRARYLVSPRVCREAS